MARIFKRVRSTGIDSAGLCSLADRYDKEGCRIGPTGWELTPGLRLQIRAQLHRLAESIPGLRKSLQVFGLLSNSITSWKEPKLYWCSAVLRIRDTVPF